MTEENTGGDGSTIDELGRDIQQPLRSLFVRYGRTKQRRLALGLFASVVSRGAGLVTPIVLGTTIDAVFNNEGAYTLPLVPSAWLPSDATSQFWLSALLVGGSLVLVALTAWLRDYMMNDFAHGVMYDIRADSYRKFQELDTVFQEEVDTGEVMSILNNDTTNLERFFDNGLQDMVRIGVMVVGVTGILLHLNYQLAVITLLALPLFIGFTWWFTQAVEPRYAGWRSSVGHLNTRLQNAISGSLLVKTAPAKGYEANRIDNAAKDLYDDAISAIRLSVVYRPGMRFLTGLILFATFVVGGTWVFTGPPGPLTGDLTVGTFVVFMLLTQRLTDPLAKLSDVVDRYENAKASGKRICGLLRAPTYVTENPDAAVLDSIDGHVEFDTVSFAYGTNNPESSADEPVLADISFTLNPGETVALVGPTGAGKSTIAKLLLRLYDVTSGEIRADGHDIREVTLGSLRESIGYVNQEPFLFDGTVAENIRYGQSQASDEAVRQAARAAQAHEFVENLRDGYGTEVGERGVKLSGGQRQRIALARVFLQDPDVVVLDEATASVDTETELLINRSLTELAEERSTIAIAHRLSTVCDADRILVIEDGQIVERGTHKYLLEEDGLYAMLWRIQTGEMDELPERLERHVATDSVVTR
ncbi:ABC transporter ATP-binding protein [Haloarcula sp. CBA1131]|uniref:ABC transporter ATP-binding protein n=1 Tax=Haloarcula sp. CBA1131 TaxID=1853686 RepID=UPI0012462BC3|nr:ABC transporter ATP-binding protein [Haloarcula sp. CBA1131]KAA9400964.1 ABC transporter ATP-binding protein [Haloarcula sp. CBA1131]